MRGACCANYRPGLPAPCADDDRAGGLAERGQTGLGASRQSGAAGGENDIDGGRRGCRLWVPPALASERPAWRPPAARRPAARRPAARRPVVRRRAWRRRAPVRAAAALPAPGRGHRRNRRWLHFGRRMTLPHERGVLGSGRRLGGCNGGGTGMPASCVSASAFTLTCARCARHERGRQDQEQKKFHPRIIALTSGSRRDRPARPQANAVHVRIGRHHGVRHVVLALGIGRIAAGFAHDQHAGGDVPGMDADSQ